MKELPKGSWGERGTWQGKTAVTSFDKHAVVIVCCPICASDSSLGEYDINQDGSVIPVFYCPYGCGFKAALKLLEYAEFYLTLQAMRAPKPDEDIARESDTNHS